MAKNKTDPHTATTRHQIYLQRVATHEAMTFDDFLKKADNTIRDVLSKGEVTGKKALAKRTAELRRRLGGVYDEWTGELLGDLEKLGGVEANFSANVLKEATINAAITTPTVAQIWTAANVVPLQINANGESKLLQPFVKSFTPQEVNRVNGVVRNGFFAGRTSAQIITQLRGTAKNQFKDGVLNVTRRAASAIARTATNHVATEARMRTMQENDDVVDGWTFSATLDSKTSTACRHYDGETFPLGEGPAPPVHIGCRSSAVPKVNPKFTPFKSPGTRASVGADGGAVTGKSPYYNWLKNQPASFQDRVLGKKMGGVFRNGGLTTDQFRKLTTNHLGKPLTIAQMEKLNPTAFAKVAPKTPKAVKVPKAAPAPRLEFTPATTVKGAEDFLVKNNLATAADYKGIDVGVANEWNKSIFEHQRRFPELRDNSQFVGSAQAQNRVAHAYSLAAYEKQLIDGGYVKTKAQATRWAKSEIKVHRMAPNTWAHSRKHPTAGGIAINEKFGQLPVEKMQRSFDYNVEVKWHPVGGNSWKALADHEMGHELDTLLDLKSDAEINAIWDAAKDYPINVTLELSEYGAVNIKEYIAEAWSEYENNPTPRPRAQKIGEIVLDRYKRLKK